MLMVMVFLRVVETESLAGLAPLSQRSGGGSIAQGGSLGK
jgi:hypothetical protein